MEWSEKILKTEEVDQEKGAIGLHFGDVKNAKIYAFNNTDILW